MPTQDSPEDHQSIPEPRRRPLKQVRGGFIVVGRTGTSHRLTVKTGHPFEHGSLEQASIEAQRLATRYGREFAVFQEVHAALPQTSRISVGAES